MNLSQQVTARWFQLSERRQYLITALICFLVLLFRLRKRLKIAHLWAEDGAVFLSQNLAKGFLSFFDSYAGYFHTVSRVVSFLLMHLIGLTWYPFATVIICAGITALIYASISLRVYRWLIPQDAVRSLVAVLFCLAIGSGEVLGNLTNIHWILYFYLWLLALKPADTTFSIGEAVAMTFVALSTGEAVVLVPLFLWRIYQQKIIHSSWKTAASTMDIYFTTVLVLTVILNLAHRESDQTAQHPSILFMAHALLITISQHLVYLPIVGPDIFTLWATLMNRWFNYLWAFIALGMAMWSVFRRPGLAGKSFLLACASAMCVPVLTFIVRPESSRWFGRMALPDAHFYDLRYYYMLAPFAIMFWAVAISGGPRMNAAKISLGLIMTASFVYGSLPLFTIFPYGNEFDWKENVKPLISSLETGCPKEVAVPVYPVGWVFYYKAKSPPETCP